MAQVGQSPEIEEVFPGYGQLRRQYLVDSMIGFLSGFLSFPSAVAGSIGRSGASKQVVQEANQAIKALRAKFPSMKLTFDGIFPAAEDAAALGMKPKMLYTSRGAESPLYRATFSTENTSAEALEQALMRKLTEFGAKP